MRAAKRLVCGLGLVAAACGHAGLAAVGGCAATPTEAVLRGLGGGGTGTGNQGYRVRDVIVDPLLLRTFVRVEACGDPSRLPILLPFAEVQKGTGTSAMAIAASPARMVAASSTALRAGTAVEVAMESSRVHLRMRGKTLAAAEVGGPVEVELATVEGGEPGRRLRGMLVSPERVEVQP